MTTYTSCATCGTLSAPWSTGHAPHCPEFKPPASCRLCPSCGYPAGVEHIEFGEHAEVTFVCRRGCAVTWVESTEVDDEGGPGE